MRLPSSLPLAIAAAALLAGCGHSPAATFLTLDPAPPASPAASYRGPPIRVPFVHVPASLDRAEFVRRSAPSTLAVDDFARWAAPLGGLARDALIRDLTQRLPGGSVLPPDAAAARPETLVEATVLDFTAGATSATMTVSYRIGALPAARIAQFRAPLADGTPAATARAWSALIGQLADRIVAELPPAPR